MGKKFDETLSLLGSEYSEKYIEDERCIYRKFGNHEIEVSGLNIPGPKYDVTLYLWEDGKVIDSIQDIHSKEELAKHLETLVQEFPSNQD